MFRKHYHEGESQILTVISFPDLNVHSVISNHLVLKVFEDVCFTARRTGAPRRQGDVYPSNHPVSPSNQDLA